ncbi:ABC transporter ATP-binding protein [Alterileibacterium massiliense]|uniref:ABC transporter ATP-binding protein n=1 Tax=Alterileibacterium massiliense TaxID=1870997 RepID=UPI0008DA6E8D|nr:ABC transporter ATP-binding protein [Alterileibacterium massiliense]
MNTPLIEFRDVYRSYGQGETEFYAVENINFTINRGEFVVILGQSGAGKSTVLNMLGGIDQPTKGSLIIDGDDISGYNEDQMEDYRGRKIGFIFQFYNLLTGLSAYENVAIANEIVHLPFNADEMLQAVGLSKKKGKFPAQLSGGEQQRVSIARALAKDPEIILGDELTGALDANTGKDVLKLVINICKENNKTLIIVTHNAAIAECADKVIHMRNAKIKEIKINENPLPVERLDL